MSYTKVLVKRTVHAGWLMVLVQLGLSSVGSAKNSAKAKTSDKISSSKSLKDQADASDFRHDLAKAKAKLKKVQPNAISGSVQFWNEMAMTQAQEGIGAPTGYIMFRLGYRASEQVSLGLGQDFMTNYGGMNASGTSMNDSDDFFGSFTHRSIFALPIGINFSTQQRVYAPTSPGSQRIGQIAQWRGYFTFSGSPADKLSIDTTFQTRYYFQQYNTGMPSTPPSGWDGTKTLYSGTEYARLRATATITYVWTEGLSTYFEGGITESFANAGIAPDTGEYIPVARASRTFAEGGLNYDFNPHFQVTMGVTTNTGHNLINPSRQFSLFRDDETNFVFSGRLAF